MTIEEQERLWVKGESVHVGARGAGRCCPDYSCCFPELAQPPAVRCAFQNGSQRARMQLSAAFTKAVAAVAFPGATLVDETGEPERAVLTHVDDFVDDYRADPYARWMFLHFRMPAVHQLLANEFLKSKLYCTWNGRRWRVTGASRMGDVWLHSNVDESFDPNNSEAPYYEERVEIDECSEWSPTVEAPR